jgi:hypothetical protein
VLRSVGGLAVEIAARFAEPLAFQQAASGEYFVFDRRAHAVYRLDAAGTLQRLVEIGHEEGRLLEPTAFDLAPDGSFAVADAPGLVERVQVFVASGGRVTGFTLPGRTTPRIVLDGLVLNGVGSLRYTGSSILINQPETGALITEYSLSGRALRSIGTLRRTGYEQDRDLHLALNTGIPLLDPRGGYYFVFQAGIPLFRKYDAHGRFVFERHVEGRELDPLLATLPTVWPRRRLADRELPLVPPVVRTAAVDPRGQVWISLVVPYTYVYDPDGDKIRTVQFRAAGLVAPTSLFFASPSRLLVTPGCYEFAVP